jgi:hypothetical protein
MSRIADLSKGLSVDWCGGWQNRRLIQTGTRGIREAEVPCESSQSEEEPGKLYTLLCYSIIFHSQLNNKSFYNIFIIQAIKIINVGLYARV